VRPLAPVVKQVAIGGDAVKGPSNKRVEPRHMSPLMEAALFFLNGK